MATIVGGYNTNEEGNQEILRRVTNTTTGTKTALDVSTINSLVPESFDYVDISPKDGTEPTSIVYKNGGASGTTVATLTITYANGCISTVTKT